MKLLIIRPESGASASAQRATAVGFTPLLLPFFEVRPRIWDAPDPADYDALLITSRNAIRHAGDALAQLTSLPVHAVGKNSASAAIQAGFAIASTGDSGLEAIVTQAGASGHHRLLWLAGEDRSDPVISSPMQIAVRIVYASDPLPLPANATAIIASADAIALHSPRAAMLFGETVDRHGLNRHTIRLVAFSDAIAKAAGNGWGGLAIAKMPEDSALLSAAQELGKQHDMHTAGKAR